MKGSLRGKEGKGTSFFKTLWGKRKRNKRKTTGMTIKENTRSYVLEQEEESRYEIRRLEAVREPERRDISG